jgi:hypothetical protein
MDKDGKKENKKENNTVNCSICGEERTLDRIVPGRKLCKDCNNKRKKETLHKNIDNINTDIDKVCSKCDIEKNITLFSKKGMSNICLDCANLIRRKKYSNNEDVREKAIKDATEFKQKKKAERDKIKEAEIKKLEEEIGEDNTICKYCKKVKAKTRFRHNRLRCRDCERDDPRYIIHKRVRSRIHKAIKKKCKTVKYLGCSREEYIKWLTSFDEKYTLENYGTSWHIDHVIPLSRFDLEDDDEVFIAFNWRNTMPLPVKENLAKNNKILPQQIKNHVKTLKKYHKENNIELPQKFTKLYAKHLEAGNPLES